MTSIPYDVARQDLDGLLSRVIAGAEPVIVSTAAGESVVMMSLDDFSGWQETAYLLSNPTSAEHLRTSIAQIAQGRIAEHPLDES